jgi:TP901 family phage tail tape measure protein
MAAPVQINANLNLNPASINASAKQVQQALGRITNQASEFQKSLDASTARVFAFGATTSVINGITQSFKSLLSTTVSVQAKLTEINTILGAGASEFNKYRNSIFKVAKETGQTFETVADGAAELARQGLGAVESAKRLKAALVLTRISGLGAEQSVKALTAAMNGFTSAGLSANQIVNKIVAVDTAFAVSAQDLAEGFSRAGSTAEDAGVSFEQLLALITAVEQRTARGGAVIGNAFKSIFTRISRSDTIDKLQELGVQIDANQNGVQKLQALSKALDTISDPGKISKIKELAGGVFQINVVSAALKDLGSEASIFAQATETGLKASNEATQKNTELNKTLLAQINSLTVSITSFAEKLGGITFGPLLQNLLGIAEKLSSGLDAALDPEKGSKFIQGLFKVIGGFISGPGLALFTVAFFKIFRTVIKFAKDGFKTVMEMGSATERVKQIEGGIVGLLQKDVTLRKILESSSASQATKEQAVIDAIKRQNALLTQQQQIVSNIAAVAMKSGVRGFDSSTGSFQGKKGKRYAAGGSGQMEPDLMTAMINEARDAPAGAVPYVTSFRGSPAVMNTSEMQVRIGGREEILTAEQIPRFNKGTVKKGGDQFVLLTPKIGQVGEFGPMTVDKINHPYIHPIKGPDPNSIKGISDNEEADIEKKIRQSIFKEASEWTKNIKPLDKTASISSIERGFNQIAGAKGALMSAIGSAFEVGISKSLGYESLESDGGDFDVYGGKNLNKIQELFKIKQSVGDFKASDSDGNRRSFVRKVRKEIPARQRKSQNFYLRAKERAIRRDKRLNPDFYTEKGELRVRGEGGGLSGQRERIKRATSVYEQRLLRNSPQLNFSKGTISNSQLKARTKTPRFSRGSKPGLKVGRFSRGSIGKAYRSPMRRYASGTTALPPLQPTVFNASGNKAVMKSQGFKDAIKSINEMNSEAIKAAKSISDKAQREKALTQAAKDHKRNLKDLATQYNLTTKAVKRNAATQNLLSGGKGMFGKLGGGIKAQGLGVGFGLSAIGTLSQSFGQDEQGNRAEGGLGAFARVAGQASSYAATGAMLGGGLPGALIGGAIGTVVGLIGESNAEKEQQKRTEYVQEVDDLLGDFGGIQQATQSLKSLASTVGDSGLDISEALNNARMQLDATKGTGEDFEKALQQYNNVAGKVSKLLGNKDGIIALYQKGERIKSELQRLQSENIVNQFEKKLKKEMATQEAIPSLLDGVSGKNKKFLEQINTADAKILTTTKARLKQQELQKQLDLKLTDRRRKQNAQEEARLKNFLEKSEKLRSLTEGGEGRLERDLKVTGVNLFLPAQKRYAKLQEELDKMPKFSSGMDDLRKKSTLLERRDEAIGEMGKLKNFWDISDFENTVKKSFPEDSDEIKELRKKLEEAGQDFEKSVKEGSVFFVNTIKKNKDDQEKIREQRDNVLTQKTSSSAISGIVEGVQGKVIDFDYINDFRKDLAAAKTDDERAELLAEFKYMTSQMTNNSETLSQLEKEVGIGDKSIKPVISNKRLLEIEASQRTTGKDFGGQKERILSTFQSSVFNKQIGESNQELDNYDRVNRELADKQRQFADNFNGQEILDQFKRIQEALQKAAVAIEFLPEEVSKISGLASSVSEFVKTAEGNIKENTSKINNQEDELARVKAQQKVLKGEQDRIKGGN